MAPCRAGAGSRLLVRRGQFGRSLAGSVAEGALQGAACCTGTGSAAGRGFRLHLSGRRFVLGGTPWRIGERAGEAAGVFFFTAGLALAQGTVGA